MSRRLLGNIMPFDEVWRTGANAATQFTTPAPITLAGIRVTAGTYTLWTVPRKDGHADIIVNKQSGQWGTEYDENLDLGEAPLLVDTTNSSAEKFAISFAPAGARKGTLVLEWGPFRWTAPIVVD